MKSMSDTLDKFKAGICVPNSMAEVWTVVYVDLLIDISIQHDLDNFIGLDNICVSEV